MSAFEGNGFVVSPIGSLAPPKVSAHPLEATEKSFYARTEEQEMMMLRKVQGIHAPLKLQLEKRTLLKTGHLPFLPRSNASLHSLTGQDELIGFDDYLGHPLDREMMVQPHAMVERSENIFHNNGKI